MVYLFGWTGEVGLPARDQFIVVVELMTELSQVRLCPKCGAEQEWYTFQLHGKPKSQWICKPCRNRHRREYVRRNQEKVQQYRKDYYKANKATHNAQMAYWRANVLTPEMQSLYDKRSYEKHKEKRREKSRRWRQENPKAHDAQKGRRRAALRNSRTGPTPHREILRRFGLWGEECAYCGAHQQEIDHFVPLNKGGAHCIGNIVPCCRSCNASKRDKDAWDWYSVQPFFSMQRWVKLVEITEQAELCD